MDVSGLVEGPQPTPRAWQLFEEDGRRTQVLQQEGVGCPLRQYVGLARMRGMGQARAGDRIVRVQG